MTSRTGHCPRDRGTEQQVPQAATRERGQVGERTGGRRRVQQGPGAEAAPRSAQCWARVSQSRLRVERRLPELFPQQHEPGFMKQNIIMILAAHSRKDVPTGTHLGAGQEVRAAAPGRAGRDRGGWSGDGTLVCGGSPCSPDTAVG